MYHTVLKELLEIIKNEKYIQVNLKKRKEGNNLLVVSREGPSVLFSLNHVAAEILELCDGKNTIDDIISFLTNKYKKVNNEIIIKDVLYCIRNFEKLKLIKRVAE